MDWQFVLAQVVQAFIGWEVAGLCLAAIGLNLHFGYTGLLNFGQAGFMALGAYGVAMGISTFGMGLAASFFFAIGWAVLLALLLGVPTLRLRADYLAIVTIAAAEILKLIFRSASLEEYTGGSDGLQGRPVFVREFRALSPYPQGSIDLGITEVSSYTLWVVTVGWVMIGLGILLLWRLTNSPWGRVLKGIREDEDAVRSLGKNVFVYKMQSLVLGGIFGAFAGMVFAFGQVSANPDNFSPQTTFFAYTVLILGGAARVLSPIAGAFIFVGLVVLIENVVIQGLNAGWISPAVIDPAQASQFRYLVVGLALMLLMIYRPQGIFGDKKELQLDAR